MPRRTDCQRRSENLMKVFVQFCKIWVVSVAQRTRRFRRFNTRRNAAEIVEEEAQDISSGRSSGSSFSPDTLSSEDDSSDALSGNPDFSLGLSSGFSTSTSPSTSSSSSSSASTSSFTTESSYTSFDSDSDLFLDDVLPALLPVDDDSDSDDDLLGVDDDSDFDSDGSTTSTSTSGSDFSGSNDGDAEDWEDWEDFDEDADGIQWDNYQSDLMSKLGRFVRKAVEKMYSSRYEKSRKGFSRAPGQMRHVLDVWKHERPDHFRQELRVSPYTFDKIVERLINDPVFTNNSPTQNAQIPVEDQVAITLYRFGRYGNGVSRDAVAKWSGYAKGTVGLATNRVLTAILRKDFMDEAVRLPTEAEKEAAKQWVEKHSCKGWRDGWCMVDGTLIPLYERPFWYGESYFDRKCNYSLNIQIVSLPNLRIVDFGYGFTGSTHDATAWERTRLYLEHDDILHGDEFIWGDSAYPLDTWVISPYRQPDSELLDNDTFNLHVSNIRVRSEHAIGFLKGRFQSLKGLRVNIKDERTHKYATYWIVACIAVHSFAMTCEDQERALGRAEGDGYADLPDLDPFIREGASSDSESDVQFVYRPAGNAHGLARLAAGKARREHLKMLLLRARGRRAARMGQQPEDASSAEEV